MEPIPSHGSAAVLITSGAHREGGFTVVTRQKKIGTPRIGRWRAEGLGAHIIFQDLTPAFTIPPDGPHFIYRMLVLHCIAARSVAEIHARFLPADPPPIWLLQSAFDLTHRPAAVADKEAACHSEQHLQLRGNLGRMERTIRQAGGCRERNRWWKEIMLQSHMEFTRRPAAFAGRINHLQTNSRSPACACVTKSNGCGLLVERTVTSVGAVPGAETAVAVGVPFPDERGTRLCEARSLSGRVYRGESAKTTSLLYLSAAQPQFRRNRVECGPPEELDARNRCRMKGKTKFRSKEWLPQALQVHPQVQQGCPQVQLRSTIEESAQICNARSKNGLNACEDLVPWIWAQAVAISRRNEGGGHKWRHMRTRVRARMGAEDESADTDESCCIGGRCRRVVPPSGVDVVAVVVREAAANEPRLGKFPYADS
ncbi:hypothetical protein FB451DRAFT_1168978 [Mycena latifolia]|nr:hypothetical protein FB451DRAFT_1168978 [Mycena latifolia]